MSLVGTQLGHYRLIGFLNGEGMGEVYLAEDLSLSRQVAIKVMKTEGSLYPNSQTAQEALEQPGLCYRRVRWSNKPVKVKFRSL